MKLLLENWRDRLRFPKVVASFDPNPIDPQRVKEELVLTGGDVGILFWGSSMSDYTWYSVKFISDNLPKTRPFNPERYRSEELESQETLPPIFVLSDHEGNYCDEGRWKISVVDGEHRIYSYSDRLPQMNGFFGIGKQCGATIENFIGE